MNALISRDDTTGHRFQGHTAAILHHLIHLGPCRLRLHHGGPVVETLTAFGLFLARGPVLHDAASGLALDPRRVPLAYLLPGGEGEGPLLCLATAAGHITATIRPRGPAAAAILHHLVETHQPAPVDAAAIRARLRAAALVRAA